MSDLDIPRRDCDTRKSYPALCDYLRMGAGRSLRKLHKRYCEQDEENPEIEPPTTRMKTIRRWSSEHDWQERARTWDERVERYKKEQAKATMREGLALDHERVDKLKALYDRLEQELEENEALWLEDKKQLGKGDAMKIIDIVRYNTSLINDLRGVLDDLAQETGGRVDRKDVTSGGEAIVKVLKGDLMEEL